MADISAPALEKAIAKVRETHPNLSTRLETIICDVSKEASVASAVEHVDSWGGVDIMFNNAGIMHADGQLSLPESCSPTLLLSLYLPF